MLFNSYAFLFIFLPVTLVGLAATIRFNRRDLAVIWLVVTSLSFYAAQAPRHLPLLLASIMLNFLAGRLIARARAEARRLRLTIAVAANLLLLVTFKYAGFLAATMTSATGVSLPVPHIDLPVGLSFYTFTQVAFLVDVSRGNAIEYRAGRYALFVSYFPHLVAGPIIHHAAVIPQFESKRFGRFRLDDVAAGLFLFSIGLAKKVVLADALAPYVDTIFNAATHRVPLTMWEAIAGILSYALQIYFDFSGYSDMAVGLSRLLGIDLPTNFASPYKARSIIDFWRRWHMTLSRFLRDYLYIPLGGNRHGTMRRYLNLMLVMLLGGLWHGAAWGFVIWGILHGIYLWANHMWRALRPTRDVRGEGFAWTLTLVAVLSAWPFFRASSPVAALHLLGCALGENGVALPQTLGIFAQLGAVVPWLDFRPEGMFSTGLITTSPQWLLLILVCAAIALRGPNASEMLKRAVHEREGTRDWSAAYALWAGLLLALSIASLQHPSAFLYFRF